MGIGTGNEKQILNKIFKKYPYSVKVTKIMKHL